MTNYTTPRHKQLSTGRQMLAEMDCNIKRIRQGLAPWQGMDRYMLDKKVIEPVTTARAILKQEIADRAALKDWLEAIG